MAKFPTYEEMGKKVAEKALDEFLYDDKSIREWMQIIASEDAISRQAVLAQINYWISSGEYGYTNATYHLRKRINSLSPVTPQPKIGHWYIDERPESDRETICSNCEQPIFKYHKIDFDYRPKYCPNCGAKMVRPQESEDE